MAADLELPRSVLLALWLANGPSPAAVAAVQGDDEPHELADDGRFGSLDGLLRAVAPAGGESGGTPPVEVAALLPAPGDPLVGPAAAAAAGEAVLLRTVDGGTVGLVPEVARFGSALEPGYRVAWHVSEVPDWRTTVLGVVGSLDDAERDLREGLALATGALVQLDVARWRPEAAERIATVREGALPVPRMPRRLEGRRVRVLAQAARLRAIVALAAEDEGGAVNLWQADQRSTALREVDRLARRAMSAAASWLHGDGVPRHADEERPGREESSRRWRDDERREP